MRGDTEPNHWNAPMATAIVIHIAAHGTTLQPVLTTSITDRETTIAERSGTPSSHTNTYGIRYQSQYTDVTSLNTNTPINNNPARFNRTIDAISCRSRRTNSRPSGLKTADSAHSTVQNCSALQRDTY